MRDPFTYHAPTDVTAPKYAAIRDAWTHALGVCTFSVEQIGQFPAATLHANVNEATRKFADAIMEHAPSNSADTSAAYRCVRLARMAANEAIVVGSDTDPEGVLARQLDVDENVRRCTDNLIAACDTWGYAASFGGSVGGVLVPCGRPSLPRTGSDADGPYTLDAILAEARAALVEHGWTIVPDAGLCAANVDAPL